MSSAIALYPGDRAASRRRAEVAALDAIRARVVTLTQAAMQNKLGSSTSR
jgi:hypothetical protein